MDHFKLILSKMTNINNVTVYVTLLSHTLGYVLFLFLYAMFGELMTL